MKRDFCAILRVGQEFIAQSDNPQNEAAARKLVYGLAAFVSPEEMESVVLIAKHLDFDSAVAAMSQLGKEEFEWAGELLFQVAKIDGKMNEAQNKLWERFFDIYWEYKDANKG